MLISKKNLAVVVVFFMITMLPRTAQAQWKRLKKMVQKNDVTVVLENKNRLVLYNSAVQDSLILCAKKGDNCDIFAAMAKKRRGNPYRIWVVSEQFWNDPQRPRTYLAKFFQVSFIKILRFPKS